MVYICNNNEQNDESKSNSKQYLLRVVYDSEDKNVHKLLEGIFGPDQMLDVKNGKIAKVNSELTPKERDCFLGMITEALNKISVKEDSEPKNKDLEGELKESDMNEEEDFFKEENEIKEESKVSEKEDENARKVSAEKLIKEFANFLNSIL